MLVTRGRGAKDDFSIDGGLALVMFLVVYARVATAEEEAAAGCTWKHKTRALRVRPQHATRPSC